MSDQPSHWPCCPDCGQPRQTICPICHTAGDGFALADDVSVTSDPETETAAADQGDFTAESPEADLRLCSTCDEPFIPEFYRRCAGCGFDYGGGLELTTADVEASRLPTRAVWVLAGVVFVCLALLIYFASVLR